MVGSFYINGDDQTEVAFYDFQTRAFALDLINSTARVQGGGLNAVALMGTNTVGTNTLVIGGDMDFFTAPPGDTAQYAYGVAQMSLTNWGLARSGGGSKSVKWGRRNSIFTGDSNDCNK